MIFFFEFFFEFFYVNAQRRGTFGEFDQYSCSLCP
jgi:hypothetical protein